MGLATLSPPEFLAILGLIYDLEQRLRAPHLHELLRHAVMNGENKHLQFDLEQ